jgi:hypothetical protein
VLVIGTPYLWSASGYERGTFDVWLPLGLRTVGALLLGSGACAGSRLVAEGRIRTLKWTPWALIIGASAILWSDRDRLPLALTEHSVEALLALAPSNSA